MDKGQARSQPEREAVNLSTEGPVCIACNLCHGILQVDGSASFLGDKPAAFKSNEEADAAAIACDWDVGTTYCDCGCQSGTEGTTYHCCPDCVLGKHVPKVAGRMTEREALSRQITWCREQAQRDLTVPGRNDFSNYLCRLGFSDLLMEEILIQAEIEALA